MLFSSWYAADSRGRLGKHLTIGTLEWKIGRFACMYGDFYNYKIPEDTINKVREVSILFRIIDIKEFILTIILSTSEGS